jgi:hypothetical protein
MSVTIESLPHDAVGPGVALGPSLGANFQPQHILYYRLQVTKGTTELTVWQFGYPLCGMFLSTDVDSFIQMALTDDVPPLLPTADDPLTPTSVTITEPCYVVIELRSDDPSLQFKAGQPAIKTADDHHSQYRKLAHVDDQGGVTYGQAANNKTCKMIYFASRYAELNADHAYNLYVQYDGGPATGVVLKVIDPAIKNRGGDDDARVAVAQQALDRAIAQRRARRKAEKNRALRTLPSSPQTTRSRPSKP